MTALSENNGRRFEGRVALVTGAAGGIGAATARRLAEEGALLVLADRDKDGIEPVAEKLRADGFEAAAVLVDQTRPDDVDALFSAIVGTYDRLDVCFANAGFGRVEPFLDLSLSNWQRHVDVNLTGTFLICQGAARRMVSCGSGGSIVVTTSSGAVSPAALFAAYCSTKAALNMLVQVMAGELGPHDIRVNAVMPGVTETSMTQSLLDSGARALVESEIPLGRTASPDDIAAAVAYLASDESRFVTGTALLVDGGAASAGDHWFSCDYRIRGQSNWHLRHERIALDALPTG